MELDGTTFVLEIINFLVLMWLLHRFLYRPAKVALQAKADRQAAQAQALAQEREAVQSAATQLKLDQAELNEQLTKAQARLSAEIEALKQKRLQAMEAELVAERDKANARAEQERARLVAQSDQLLRQRSAGFLAEYLKRLASPAMEQAIIEIFLIDLGAQSEHARQVLGQGWPQHGDRVMDISTAYPLSEATHHRLRSQIGAVLGQSIKVQWREDPDLLSGVCAHFPGHLLEASLRQGIDAFAQLPSWPNAAGAKA